MQRLFIDSEVLCGFTSKGSCEDHIFIVRQILEKCEVKNKEIAMIFVDLEKAYDSVLMKHLWNLLEKINVNISLINSIHGIYDVTINWELNYQENLRLRKSCYKDIVCLQPLRFISR